MFAAFFRTKYPPGGLQKPYLNRYNKNEISNQYIGELKKKGKENENEKDLGSIAGNGPGIWPDSLRDQKMRERLRLPWKLQLQQKPLRLRKRQPLSRRLPRRGTIVDGNGREVEIPSTVESIVCVGVGALRYTCYVGGADLVVGVEDYETDESGSVFRLYNYVNFDKFRDLPVTGTNGTPFEEEIIKVDPQVIVMSAYASVDADELEAKTNIPVVVVPGSDTTLDDKAYETTVFWASCTAWKTVQQS